MKISELRTGFLLMEKHKFNIKDINTLTAPLVFFFINIWNKIKNRPICIHTHNMSVVILNDIPYIFEAINGGYKRMSLQEKIKERGIENLLILEPIYIYNSDLFAKSAINLSNKLKYSIKGLVDEIPYNLSDGRIWLGSRKLGKRGFCSEDDSYNIFISTNKQIFPNYYQISPNDLFQSNLFNHHILEL